MFIAYRVGVYTSYQIVNSLYLQDNQLTQHSYAKALFSP